MRIKPLIIIKHNVFMSSVDRADHDDLLPIRTQKNSENYISRLYFWVGHKR